MNFNETINPAQNGFLNPIGPKVSLYIFTPTQHNDVVVRPYIYNFNSNMVDSFINCNSIGDNFKYMMSSGNMLDSILPSPNGIQLNTSMLDSYYSFILIIDSAEEVRSMLAFGQPKRRTVLTGYFYDEPLNQMTLWSSSPTINPNAVMVFTHNTSLLLNSGSQYGSNTRKKINISAMHDIIPQSTESFTDLNGLALCDIGSITNAFKPDDYSEESVATGIPYALSGFNNNSPTIHNRVKSPKEQLIDIAFGVDQAVHMAKTDSVVYGQFGNENESLLGNDNNELFMSNLYSYFSRPDITQVQQGINSSTCITLQELINMYNNTEIIPCQVPFNPEYDVRSQSEINIQTVFSSLASKVINATAESMLISTIAFRYSSWNKANSMDRGGAWEILSANSMIGKEDDDGSGLDTAIRNFMKELEISLFPILLKAGGEFDIVANYDATGNTSIDLYFLDYYNESHAYYTDHNRLGGMTSPALGTFDNVTHNRNQFDTLASELSKNGIVQTHG
jgi:hypothetical protein